MSTAVDTRTTRRITAINAAEGFSFLGRTGPGSHNFVAASCSGQSVWRLSHSYAASIKAAERVIDATCRIDYPKDRLQIQVLDDKAPKHATIKPWQFNGSIYNVVPAKNGIPKIGEWNAYEITARGRGPASGHCRSRRAPRRPCRASPRS